MGLFSSNATDAFSWEKLEETTDLEGTCVVFKHSPRCAISRMALSQFERRAKEWEAKESLRWIKVDVLEQRPFSNAIAEKWEVRHESPQLLVLREGVLLAHASHEQIELEVVTDALSR